MSCMSGSGIPALIVGPNLLSLQYISKVRIKLKGDLQLLVCRMSCT